MSEFNITTVNCVTPGTLGTAAVKYFYAMKAPSASLGGGLTVLWACASQHTAHATGSAPNFRLLKAGTSGAINGTIAGSIAVEAAGTPLAFTVTPTFVDAGEYVVVETNGTALSAVELNGPVIIGWAPGRGGG
jgi:hypothetical protein